MAVQIKHPFQSAIADDPAAAAAGEVLPSHWNADHDLTGTANQLLGFDGSGNATEVDPATVGSGIPDAPSDGGKYVRQNTQWFDITGSLGGGSGVWEVIGDTLVSSTITSIPFNFDITAYSEIKAVIRALSVESGTDMFFGFQLQQVDGTVVGDFSGLVEVSPAPGFATKISGKFELVLPPDANSPNLVYWAVFGPHMSIGFSNAVGLNQGGASQSATLSSVAKIVFFFSDDTSDFDVATASNILAGRLTLYGLKFA